MLKALLIALWSACLCLVCAPAQASAFPWAALLLQRQFQVQDDQQVAEFLSRSARQPVSEPGPGQVEDVEYYVNELLLDENWEEWLIFQNNTITVIPLASAKFYIYADAEMDRLKKPSIRVIIERTPKTKQVSQDDLERRTRLKRMYKGLGDLGLADRDTHASSNSGWNVLSWFRDPDTSTRGMERDWDWWLVIQKMVFVSALVLGCLIFVEALRMVFGAGVKAISDGQRRRKKRLLRH